MPDRIQRTENWRKSDTQVYVGPRSPFKNPFGRSTGRSTASRQYLVDDFKRWLTYPDEVLAMTRLANGAKHHHMGVPYEDRKPILDALESLRGKDLVCSCHLNQPCHADVLLELANPNERGQQ